MSETAKASAPSKVDTDPTALTASSSSGDRACALTSETASAKVGKADPTAGTATEKSIAGKTLQTVNRALDVDDSDAGGAAFNAARSKATYLASKAAPPIARHVRASISKTKAAYDEAKGAESLVGNAEQLNAVDGGLVGNASDKALAATGKAAKSSIGAKASSAAALGKKSLKTLGKDALKSKVTEVGEAALSVSEEEAGGQAYNTARRLTTAATKRAARCGMKNWRTAYSAFKEARAARKAAGVAGTISSSAKAAAGKAVAANALPSGGVASAMAAKTMAAGKAAQAAVAGVVAKVVAAVTSAIAAFTAAATPALAVGAAVASAIAVVLTVVSFITSIFTVAPALDASSTSGYTQLTELEQPVAKFLEEKGLDATHIAALIGVWRCESACDPQQCQIGTWSAYDENGTVTATYTFSYPTHSESSRTANYPDGLEGNGSFGYGICQWTSPGRSWGLVNKAKEMGKNSGDIEVQLAYFWDELTGSYAESTYYPFLAATDLDECARVFTIYYEGNEGGYNAERSQAVHDVYNAICSGSSNLIEWARSKLGVEYHWAAQGICPKDGAVGYDCSGLVCAAILAAGLDDDSGIFGSNETATHGAATYAMLSYFQSSDKWEICSAQEGAICMFINSSGECTHVGIMSSDSTVIEEPGSDHRDAVCKEGAIWTFQGGYNMYYKHK